MRNKIRMAAWTGVIGLALLLGVSWAQSVPQLINYQGRITNAVGQPLADGTTVDLTFTFYGAESGPTPRYLTVFQKDVVVTAGIYNVLIGSGMIAPGVEYTLAAVFQRHAEVWLGVKVDADPEMTLRARISSVPYAMNVDMRSIGDFLAKPDWDGDGYLKSGNTVDCNDGDASIYPRAPEVCDGIDNQCPGDSGYGLVDEVGVCGPPRSAMRVLAIAANKNYVWTTTPLAPIPPDPAWFLPARGKCYKTGATTWSSCYQPIDLNSSDIAWSWVYAQEISYWWAALGYWLIWDDPSGVPVQEMLGRVEDFDAFRERYRVAKGLSEKPLYKCPVATLELWGDAPYSMWFFDGGSPNAPLADGNVQAREIWRFCNAIDPGATLL